MARQLNEGSSNTEQLWPKGLLINQAMASTLMCSVCDGAPRKCNTDGEGDIFCGKCAEDQQDAVPSKALQKMINQLKIRCMIANGDGKGEKDVEGVVNVIVTQIEDECDWVGMIKEWDQHEQECPILVIKCDKCNKYESQRQFMSEHLNHCPDMDIPCPSSCGISILKKNIKDHKSNQCNKTLLSCTNHGCKLQIPREDLENHIKMLCKYKIDSQSNQLMRSETKEYTSCSNCKRAAHDIELFICTKDNCDSFGEIYCPKCGDLSHSIYDHAFDIKLVHIKPVSLSIINQDIEKGMRRLTGMNGTMDEHKYGGIRTLCESSVIAAFFGGLAGEISDTTKAMAFGKVGKELIKGVKHASKMSNVCTKATGGVVTKFATDITTKAAGGAGIGAGIMFGMEFAWHSYRFWTGEIETWKEFGYHVAKSVVASIASGICNFVGTAVGAAVGTLIGGPIGTVIGGVIGGFIGGIIGAKLGRKAFDKIWKDEWIHDEQKQRTDLIKKSLYLFGILNVTDINNPEMFNKKRLKKKYRELAKIYHPDRNDGSPESVQQFAEINTALGVLLSLLENKDKRKQVRKLQEVKAITLNHDIHKLRKEFDKLRKELKSAQLMFIIDYLTKWNEKYTLEMVLMHQNILKLISDMNNDHNFEHKVINKARDKFVEVIKTWKEKRNTEDKDIVAIADRKWLDKQIMDDEKHVKQIGNHGRNVVSDKDKEDAKEIIQCDHDLQNDKSMEEIKDQDMLNEEKKEDEHINVNDMEDLKDRLKEKGVLDVAKICEEYDEDLTLDELLNWRKKDILETLDKIDDDKSNKYSISARKKKKFVKIIYEFSNRK